MGHLLGRRAHADGGRRKRRGEKSGDSDSSSSEGEGEEEEESGGEEKRKNEEGGLNPFEGHHDEEFKLVLVVRADIGMTKGTYLYNPFFPSYLFSPPPSSSSFLQSYIFFFTTTYQKTPSPLPTH